MIDWYVYIVKCADSSLYTGISPDVENRVVLHNAGLGAKSVKGKLPVVLVYNEKIGSKIEAAKREIEIKGWSRTKKQELINSRNMVLALRNQLRVNTEERLH